MNAPPMFEAREARTKDQLPKPDRHSKQALSLGEHHYMSPAVYKVPFIYGITVYGTVSVHSIQYLP